MNEKRVTELQESYMANESTEDLKGMYLRKNLEPDGLEAARRELLKRGIDPNNISESIIDSENDNQETDKDTKTCPYCAEEIKYAAIKCRYCGSDLFDDEDQDYENRTGTNWSFSIGLGLFISIIILLPHIYDLFLLTQDPQVNDALVFRMSLQDILFRGATNFALYTIIVAIIVWIWRKFT